MTDIEDYVRVQNIERYRALIAAETDPARRRQLQALLDRELSSQRNENPQKPHPT